MVQINFAQKSVNLKVVYYGPGMSGKTTNLEIIHQRAPEGNRGDLTSISTDGDRTLFFDFMPLDLGTVAGMRTAFQLYTVPGQVYYNSTRKLVLQGVDGIIFVADSSASMVNQNLESLRNLEENLNEYGKSLATLPHAIQFNKRDLPDAMTVEELGKLLNPHNAPCFEAIANSGQGVFPTLKALAANVLKNIMNESGQGPQKSQYPGGPPSQAGPRPTPNVAPARPSAPFPQPSQPLGAQPAYPPVGLPQAPGGAGFFPGQATQPQPMAAHSAQGLQLAQPGVSMSAGHAPAQPARQARPDMAARPAQTPPARAPQQRAVAQSKGRPPAPRKQPAQPTKSSRGKLTPIFIVAGASVGAVLAWVLMNVL